MNAVFYSEHMEMDAIYDAIDCCNNAQKQALRLDDTELEVRCEAFLGKIYYRALRDLQRARRHLMNTIRLEFTLRPRSCQNEPWFKACQAELSEINEHFRREEEAN